MEEKRMENCLMNEYGCADGGISTYNCQKCGFDRAENERRREIGFTLNPKTGLMRKIVGTKGRV